MAKMTLAMLPGLMCDAAVWSPLYPHLGRTVSPWVPDYGDLDDLGAMADRVLQQVPSERFALAGHSMGGRVALEVVRKAPHRVTHLALMDTGYLARPAGAAGEQEAQKRHALLQIAKTEGVRAMAQTWVQGMVHPARLQDSALLESVLAMFARKTADIFASQIAALLARPDASPVLSAWNKPTLLLCGAQDEWSPPTQHAAMQALLPDALLAVVEHAGHMAPMERPVAVAQRLSDYLQRGEGGA
ncbi:alpha/beta hydrolase [Rhodoferax sp. GW822-FHT02A01]|uniref:alpha/beta fold hydrolase n=1 Tax=Rhodoferax sp. GW822-FHT02A01 TaxID=3141537 RepID=UPI00315DE059